MRIAIQCPWTNLQFFFLLCETTRVKTASKVPVAARCVTFQLIQWLEGHMERASASRHTAHISQFEGKWSRTPWKHNVRHVFWNSAQCSSLFGYKVGSGKNNLYQKAISENCQNNLQLKTVWGKIDCIKKNLFQILVFSHN